MPAYELRTSLSRSIRAKSVNAKEINEPDTRRVSLGSRNPESCETQRTRYIEKGDVYRLRDRASIGRKRKKERARQCTSLLDDKSALVKLQRASIRWPFRTRAPWSARCRRDMLTFFGTLPRLISNGVIGRSMPFVAASFLPRSYFLVSHSTTSSLIAAR